MIESNIWRRLIMMAATLFFALSAAAAWAEVLAYRDFEGNWQTIDTSQPRAKLQATSTVQLASSNITWNVSYLDPAGSGFNDTAEGANRKAALAGVLDYLNTVLNYPGRTLDIEVEVSVNNSWTSTLAQAGTYFYTSGTGFTNGLADQHLESGSDPSTSTPDIYVIVNFAYSWYTGTGTPGFGSYDLRTVLLHECTHGLGILSMLSADGKSQLTSTNPGVYSVWDSFLQTGTGAALFNTAGKFLGQSSDLTGGSSGIYFTGAQAVANYGALAAVYTPSSFARGSSISHWNASMAYGGAVMEPFTASGTVRRTYSAVDLGALSDIGLNLFDAGSPSDPPVVQFNLATMSANEGNSATVAVSLSTTASKAVTVDVSATGGTATSAADYSGASQTLTFPAGTKTQYVSIPLASDATYEAAETVELTLASPDGATLGTNQTLVLTINNVDDLPALAFSAPSALNETSGLAAVQVKLTGNVTALPVTVDFTTNGGTAAAGSDYQAVSGTLNFAPGERSQTLSILLIDDARYDGDKTFNLILANPTGAALSQSSMTLSVADNEELPTMTFQAQTTLTEAGTAAQIEIDLSGSETDFPVTVEYATDGGSAIAGTDYQAASGTLTFAPGERSKTFSITLLNDAVVDGDKTFGLTLSNPSGATLAQTAWTFTITDDDAEPGLSIAATAAMFDESSSSATLQVALTGNETEFPVTVQYAAGGGTAIAQKDYQPTSGTLTFAPGERAKTLTVPLLDDKAVDGDKTLIVTLSNPAGATLGQGSAELTIKDNDVETAARDWRRYE